MAGHSHASNVAVTKGKTDAARSKIFTKINREIAVAVKAGGPDTSNNAKLRDVIKKARYYNMTNDAIQKTIKKASGELSTINYETVIYEGYGASGSAVMIEALTDNRNRTAGDVRHCFDKFGGSMGTINSVSFMFDKKGVITLAKNMPEEDVFIAVIEAGAHDFEATEENYIVYINPENYQTVNQKIALLPVEVLTSELRYMPQTKVNLSDADVELFDKMLDKFNELDDVQNVYHNVE